MTGLLCACLLWAAPARATDPESLEALLDIVEERAGSELDREALYRAAMAGVTDALNARTGGSNAVLTRDEWQEALAWHRGDRSGVGMEYMLSPRRGLLITDVFPGGPGERAGLQRGDLVVGIDGVPFSGLEEAHIHELVLDRSERPEVTLEIRGTAGVRRVPVQRARYRMTNVRAVEGTPHPCLRLTFFGEGSADQLAAALSQMSDQALVLDLRDNEGGLIDEAVAAADLFLARGQQILQRARADGSATVDAAQRDRTFSGELVLLVNRGTRGPAEAFVAALRDHGVARLVGTPTAGEATLPDYRALGDSLVVQLADTWLRSPGGTSWSGDGLQPDVLIEPIGQLGPGRGLLPDLQRDAGLQLIGHQSGARD